MENEKLVGIIIGSIVAVIFVTIITFFIIRFLRKRQNAIIENNLSDNQESKKDYIQVDGVTDLNQKQPPLSKLVSSMQSFFKFKSSANNDERIEPRSVDIISDEYIGAGIVYKIIQKINSNGGKNIEIDGKVINQYMMREVGTEVFAKIGRECKATLFNFLIFNHKNLHLKVEDLSFYDLIKYIMPKAGNQASTNIFFRASHDATYGDESIKFNRIFRLFAEAKRNDTKYGDNIYNAINLWPLYHYTETEPIFSHICINMNFQKTSADNFVSDSWKYVSHALIEGDSKEILINANNVAMMELFIKFKYLFEPFFENEKVKKDFEVINNALNKPIKITRGEDMNPAGCSIPNVVKKQCATLLSFLKQNLALITQDGFKEYVADSTHKNIKEVSYLLQCLNDAKFTPDGMISFLHNESLMLEENSQTNSDTVIYSFDFIKSRSPDLSKINVGSYDSEKIDKESKELLDQYQSFLVSIIQKIEKIYNSNILSADDESKLISSMRSVIPNMSNMNDQSYFEAMGGGFQHLFSIDSTAQEILFSKIIDSINLPKDFTQIDTKSVCDLYKDALNLSNASKKKAFMKIACEQLNDINMKFDETKLPVLSNSIVINGQERDIFSTSFQKEFLLDILAERNKPKFFDLIFENSPNVSASEAKNEFMQGEQEDANQTFVKSIDADEVVQRPYGKC